MSRAVRIREHLHAEIERLARENRRTIIDQLELLLEQAIRLQDSEGATKTGERRTEPSDTGAAAPSPDDQAAATGKEQEARAHSFRPGDDALRPPLSDDHFRPDFKKEKRK